MRWLLIYILFFISTSLSAQDSLRLIPVHAWRLSRLIGDAQALRLCDSTVTILSTSIDTISLALQATKKLTLIMSSENELLTTANRIHIEQALNQELIFNSEKKVIRKKAFKRGLIIGGSGGIILLLFLL